MLYYGFLTKSSVSFWLWFRLWLRLWLPVLTILWRPFDHVDCRLSGIYRNVSNTGESKTDSSVGIAGSVEGVQGARHCHGDKQREYQDPDHDCCKGVSLLSTHCTRVWWQRCSENPM